MSDHIEPCPECGISKVRVFASYSSTRVTMVHIIECANCNQSEQGYSKGHVAERWNALPRVKRLSVRRNGH